MQYLNLCGNVERSDLEVHAKMDHNVVTDLNINPVEKTMVVYDINSTRNIQLSYVRIQPTNVIIISGPQTVETTLDCMLDCLVAIMRRGM